MLVRLYRRRRRRAWWRSVLFASFAVTATVGTLADPAPADAQAVEVAHQPPVLAPVVDGFRPPPSPFGAGNRGIEYDTTAGQPVRASADGRVVFAGAVASSLHVTVAHADGVRTSYSYLRRVDVGVGQAVRAGEVLGTAGERLHFGARSGDTYIDPAGLFGATGPQVELLPLEVPPGGDAADAAAELRRRFLAERGGGGLDLALSTFGAVTRAFVERLRLQQHYLHELDPLRRSATVARQLVERLAFPPPCTDDPAPARPAAGQRRHAVLVGGLGSSSTAGSIDDLRTDRLGYAPGSVERFSYAGGDAPYSSADTQGDLLVSARHLADTVERALRDDPAVTVDVFAHSMGGVVARLMLLELDRRGIDLQRLGVVATLGSPHGGADLATAVAALNSAPVGNVGLDAAERLLGTGLDPDAPAIAQLAETSDVVELLDRAGVPPGVELVSIAARGDVVVPSTKARVDGARNVVVSLEGRAAHGRMVGAGETTDELARALAGMPQACEAVGEVVEELLLGHGISYLEDVAGFTALNGTR